MHLEAFSVLGFRSLADVSDVPISNPTILAGPNDGGKTAALAALSFLLGDHSVTEEDRTYLEGESGNRCPLTAVTGRFRLDDWEQEKLHLPAHLRIRRRIDAELAPVYELWARVPDDEELRDLSSRTVIQLKELLKQFKLRADSQVKASLQATLYAYADEHSTQEGWTGLPPGLLERFPRIAAFEGRTLEPEAAVKSVLSLRFKNYVAEETTRNRVKGLESDAEQWLAIEAKPLADHIVERCKDIATVTVDPKVTYAPSLQSTSLRLERSTGELVRLDRSGRGSSRRISMAIWEATSDMLVEQARTEEETSENGPPVQVIVMYDEPDTHLDYHYQREVMRLIRDQGKVAHVSVVVATHSMNLIDGVDIRDVVLLKLDDNRRTCLERLGSGEHSEFDRHLGVIAAAVGLRNSVLLHERCFLAVEGETEQQAFPILFALSEGIPLQAAGIALWGCGGNAGALNLAEYLHKHGRTVVLVVDADSENGEKPFKPTTLKKTFGPKYDELVIMLGGPDDEKELEELWDDITWAGVANEEWPRDGGWAPEHFKAIRGQGKFSDKVRGMLWQHGENAPTQKPPMMMALVSRLERVDQVPQLLRETFSKIRKRAG